MTNITIILFTFVFLVAQNILLLNEEALILLCFVIFTTLSLNNLSMSVSSSFQEQASQIEDSLKTSLKNHLEFLQNFTVLKTSLKKVLQNFTVLKTYHLKLIALLTSFSSNYNKSFLTYFYNERLSLLGKVENQMTKLLVVVLIRKLDNTINTKNFCRVSLKSSQFLCLDAILLRERIHSITIKK